MSYGPAASGPERLENPLRRFLALVLSTAAACLLLVACGNGDEGSTSTPADDAATETDAPADDTSDDEAEAGTNEAEAMDISSLSDFECLKIGNALTAIVGRGVIGDVDQGLATVRSFGAGAPAETHADFDTALDAYEESYRMLEDAGISLAAASDVHANQDTVDAATALIEAPEVEAALEAVEEVFFDACPTMRDQG